MNKVTKYRALNYYRQAALANVIHNDVILTMRNIGGPVIHDSFVLNHEWEVERLREVREKAFNRLGLKEA